jgi:hypothetical protein
LNENLAPAGHYLYDESQAHLPANHRSANLVNLSYVTARVSHRPQTLYLHIMNTVRKDSAVHVSLSSYLIVKQQSLVKKNSLPNPATHLRPAPKRPLPGFFTGWFLGPRNSRETIRAGRPRQRWRRCLAYRSSPLRLSTCVFKKRPKRSATTAQLRRIYPLLQLLTPVIYSGSLLARSTIWPGGHSVFRPSPRKKSSSRGRLDIIANMESARGPSKKNKNKDSKASMRAASLNLYLTRGHKAPTPAVRHPA